MIGVGVDIGGTFVKLFVMNEHGEIFRKEKVETDYSKGSKGFIAQIGDFINGIQKEFADQRVAVAVGAPGDVDNQNGVLRYNPNLKFKDVADWPMAEQLFKHTGIRPVIANDATLAAWGVYEADLKLQGTNVLVVTLGTGVGGGIIEDSRIVTGCNWAAGELGHFVIDMNGEPCNCGLRGCFEQYGSVTALIAQTRAAMRAAPDSLLWEQAGGSEQLVNGRTAFDAMRRGDASAKAVVDGYVHYLCVGITSIVNIFQPEVLCVGGGISREGEAVMAPVRAYVGKYGYARGSAKQPRIVAASLAGDAGIIGAALLGTEKK